MTNLTVRNNLQATILRLLEIDFDMNLFTELGILWDLDLSIKDLTHESFKIAGLVH